eukprot:9503695-Pyramimonas_sp.AAC.1
MLEPKKKKGDRDRLDLLAGARLAAADQARGRLLGPEGGEAPGRGAAGFFVPAGGTGARAAGRGGPRLGISAGAGLADIARFYDSLSVETAAPASMELGFPMRALELQLHAVCRFVRHDGAYAQACLAG